MLKLYYIMTSVGPAR